MRRFVNTGRWHLLLAMTTGLAACGGAAPKHEAAPLAAPTAVVHANPKIRVAVGKFTELEAARGLFEQMGLKGVGPMITEQAVTGLTQTDRVLVLERSQLGTVLGNEKLEKESDQAKYFDQSTTAETGKMLGAQAVLVGSLTQFEPNISGGGGGLDLGKLGSLKYHEDKAVVGVDLRLVDQQTGKVLVAAPGVAEIVTKTGTADGSYAGIGLTAEGFSKTPLADATREATNKALEVLSKAVASLPWEGGVIDVRGPEKVFIDAGADVAMTVGVRLRVVHRGDAIKAPDGTTMGFDDSEAGLVEVVDVQKKMSTAKVVEGDGPKAGDRVRTLPQ